MALIDFTLSNTRRFYFSMGNPIGWKGLKASMFITNMEIKPNTIQINLNEIKENQSKRCL